MLIDYTASAGLQHQSYQDTELHSWLGGEGGAAPDQPIALWDILAPQWTVWTYLSGEGGIAPGGAGRKFYWLGHPPH